LLAGSEAVHPAIAATVNPTLGVEIRRELSSPVVST
jgi:hypothetical protein